LLTSQTAAQAKQLAAAQQEAETGAARVIQAKAEWAHQAGHLQAALAEAQKTVTGLRGELEKARTAAGQRDTELERVSDTGHALSRQKAELSTQLLAAQTQVATIRAQSAALTETERRVRDDLARVTAELEQTKQQLAKALEQSHAGPATETQPLAAA